MMQYKSFAFSQFRTLKNIQQFGSGSATAQSVLGASGIGALVIATRALMKGQELPDFSDPANWVKAFIQGGSGGLAADMLNSIHHGGLKSLGKSIAGPAPSFLGERLVEAADVAGLLKQRKGFGRKSRPASEKIEKLMIDAAASAANVVPFAGGYLKKKVGENLKEMTK